MASGEMLKKLLDEFVEKEALVAEELKVITEQIEELESRLEKCRVRLGTIGNDRNRVLEIKQRYGGGPFYTRSEMVLTGTPVQAPVAQAPQPVAPVHYDPPPQPPQPQPQPQPQQVAPVPEPPKPPAPPEPGSVPNTLINALLGGRKAEPAPPIAFEMEPSNLQQQLPTPGEVVPQPTPQPPPPQAQPEEQPPAPAAAEEKVVDIEQTQNEDDSDTVKSINDALRSLFR